MHTMKIRWMMVVALVLAGAGLLLASCSDLPGGTPTTTVSLSVTTVVGVETSVVATSTSGAPTTATTAVPATTPTTAAPTTTTHATAPPITTTTLDPSAVHIAYIESVHHLLNQTDLNETRIPELVTQITSTMPSVPSAVRAELADMVSWITMYRPEADTIPPAGYEDAQNWLGQAADHMLVWCSDLIAAIDVMGGSGNPALGAPLLAAALGEQAAYTAAKAAHYAAYPSY
jgi:hypothetical protein